MKNLKNLSIRPNTAEKNEKKIWKTRNNIFKKVNFYFSCSKKLKNESKYHLIVRKTENKIILKKNIDANFTK